MEGRTTIQVSEGLRKELKSLAGRRDKNYQELLSDMVEVFKELDKEKTIISIPIGLAERIDERVATSDFRTKSDYITFLLRLLLYETEEKQEHIDEKRIKKRLKSLGYI